MTGIVANYLRNQFRRATTALLCAAACAAVARAQAQGLTYVEGIDQLGGGQQNIFRADGGDINTALDPNQLANGSVAGNNLWNYRDEGVPEPINNFATIYESIQEDSPELRQQINGLTANGSYDVYVAFWSDQTDWGVRAGFTSNPNTNPLFNRNAGNGGTASPLAGAAAWTTLPADNPEGTDDDPSPFINITTLGGTVAATTQTMYLGRVGTTTASPTGQISVYIDDLPSLTDGNIRSWFDGLAYVTAGTQVFVTATVDRGTGNLTINNPTGSVYNIASYTLASAGGSFVPGQWDSIAVGGNATISETHPWAVTTSTAAQLSEAETPAVNGAQLVAVTGAFNLGNVWARTPIQDIAITLNLVGGGTVTVAPTYSGTAIANGDFNADSALNVADFTILKTNFGSNNSALTLAQAYQVGDMTRDRTIDKTDFLAFRSAYNAVNGAGAFEAMVRSIPEPSTAVLVIPALGLLRRRRNRKSAAPSTLRTPVARKQVRWACVAAAFLLAAGARSAQAQTITPVTGWYAFSAGDGHAIPVINGTTNSPSIGDGTLDNADNSTVWAALQPVTVANGQELVLRGRVQFIGIPITGDAFRFGMFDGANFTDPYNPAIEPLVVNVPAGRSTAQPNGWLGFLASNVSNGGTASLDARNPAAGSSTQFISTAGGGDVYPVAGLGPADQTWDNDNNPITPPVAKTQTPGNRVIRLSTAITQGNFDADTYDFTLTLGRFGFENTISSKLVSRTILGDLTGDGFCDGSDLLAWQRQATPAAAQLAVIRTNFGKANPDYSTNLSATLSPSQDTVPTMITNEVDRIGFLMANGMDTDQAVFTSVQLELRQIQSLILDVNTVTGKVSVRNAAGVSFDITYYEITSVNGNLNPAGWVSLDDGEGGDPNGIGWDELGPGTANLLAEGNLTGSRLVANGQGFQLQTAFNTATTLGNRDTNFFFATTDGEIHRGVVNYNTTSTQAAVPEPSCLALGFIGLIGVGRRKWRK